MTKTGSTQEPDRTRSETRSRARSTKEAMCMRTWERG
jgi:hypothetical protein